jgi:hypothetical protein
MPLNSERVRPRRTPRLGFPPERPPFTPERLRRRRADYRRFRALIQTPEGCVQFMQEYVRVAPEAGTAKVFRWFDWVVRTQSPTPEQLERARTLVEMLLRG